jgi:hypothetical protein
MVGMPALYEWVGIAQARVLGLRDRQRRIFVLFELSFALFDLSHHIWELLQFFRDLSPMNLQSSAACTMVINYDPSHSWASDAREEPISASVYC